MEQLGFKIVDVELVQETKADELSQQFQEVCPSAAYCSTVRSANCYAGILNRMNWVGCWTAH